jgi:hypothetical protein
MSTETCKPLMRLLTDLSRVYPELRFGQLIAMIAVLSSEETPMTPAEVEDDRLVDTAFHHLSVRQHQLGTENRPLQERSLAESRTELLDVLQNVWERHRNGRFGSLLEQLAASSGCSLYDAEDEHLIAAAQSFLADQRRSG